MNSAFIDCLPWDRKPDVAAQVSAYMCISRLEHIDDMYITQPYAPTLFEQGEPPGPDILLRFRRGEIPLKNLAKEWIAMKDFAKKERTKWPDDMPLYCRGCSAAAREEVYRVAKQFTHTNASTLWDDVICQGMERFCTKCEAARGGARAKEQAQPGQQTYADVCVWCGSAPPDKKRTVGTMALCTACSKIQVKCQKCSKRAKKDRLIFLFAFSLERVLHCNKNTGACRVEQFVSIATAEKR